MPKPPEERKRSGQIDKVNSNNKLMAELMAMALACNQTKVFIGRPHECDLRDVSPGRLGYLSPCIPTMNPSIRELGYQVISSKLAELSFHGYSDFIRALDAIKEGDGTLLDHTLVLGLQRYRLRQDSFDRQHSAVSCGWRHNGKHKGGVHVVGNGDPVSRISLTAQQMIGMPVGEFGVGSMKTAKTLGEVVNA